MTDRARRLIVPITAFLFGLVVLSIAAVVTLAPGGREPGPSAVGGPFALVDQDGRPVTEKDFLGRPHLVFFGFTHCPDVCPTKLFEISQILAATGERGREIRALFITVDPERDTPAIMKSYISSFDERIVGLTGSPEAVAAATRTFRGFAKKVPTEGGDYTMEHTSIVYVMDAKGRFVNALDTTRPPADAARTLLAEIGR